ncbi:hypothetical protein DPMN_121236 [Dreissena polymorpha]|uniref:Uncharacterized protein n=1 Tax=Dreissena polymorpha TaxID=45954 RepID=A0A9D4JSX3_DREPO|nr:hypothetical protein DPMN_121236 [Dreissena polymorpha]
MIKILLYCKIRCNVNDFLACVSIAQSGNGLEIVHQPGFFLTGQSRNTSCSYSVNMDFSQDTIPQGLHMFIELYGCFSDRNIVLHDTYIGI